MAKEVIKVIKLQLPAGKANPAPPVGPALGQHGVNIMEFCKAFNAKSQDKAGWWSMEFILPLYIYQIIRYLLVYYFYSHRSCRSC